MVADYLVSIYLHDDRGVYVNLYAPSEVKWNNVRLVQETSYPEAETTRITVRGSGEFSIRLRVPRLTSGMQVSMNGEPIAVPINPGQFVEVRRNWHDGDVLQARIPMVIREEPVDAQHPNLVAVMRGPVMLVAAMDPQVKLAMGAPGDVRAAPAAAMMPFYRVKDEVYTTYLTKT